MGIQQLNQYSLAYSTGKEGKMWVQMYDEVRLRPCPKPPLKNFVLKAVENAL